MHEDQEQEPLVCVGIWVNPDELETAVKGLLETFEELVITSQNSQSMVDFISCMSEAMGIIQALGLTELIDREKTVVYTERLIGLTELFKLGMLVAP